MTAYFFLLMNSDFLEVPSERADFDLRDFIEHTLLDPFATQADIERLCQEADHYRFPGVCIASCHVAQAVEILHRGKCQVYTVIGFPTGAVSTRTKLFEAQEAVDNGADGLDVVINFSWLRDQSLEKLHGELAEICDVTQKPIKAILEMARLSETEKETVAEICLDAGVTYLKTSTGWFGGATVADIRLLKRLVGDRAGIKASGGIKHYGQAVALIQAGATRLGTSRGVDLIQLQDQI